MYRQGGSHHSSNGDQLGRAGRRRQSLGVPPGREPPQLKRRPTGQGREEEAESRCTAREGATTDNSRSKGRRQRRSTPVHRCEIEKISCNLTGTRSTFFFLFFFSFFFFLFLFFLIPLGIGNQEREGRVLVYRQGGSHHSSNGDQLGRAGRRRQSLGVPPGREPPQLKRRPTGQGREEEAESRCTAREGATTDNSRSKGRRQRRSTPVHRCEIEKISCNLTGTRSTFFFSFFFFLFFCFLFLFFFNPIGYWKSRERRQSLGVPPGREPPQLKRRPTG